MSGSLPERPYDRNLNSEIERVVYQVDVVVMDAKGLAGGLSREQFNWKPDGGRWSVGQCIEHLNITGRRWLPLFEEAVENGRKNGPTSAGPFSYGFLERMFLRVMEPPVKRFKVGTPKDFRPGEDLDPEVVTNTFVELHQRIRRCMMNSNGLDLARIKVRSAFSSRIRYSLGMGYWILTAHDRRHIWQARQARQAPNFLKRVGETAS